MSVHFPALKEIEAIKIIKEVKTKGSSPLLVLCNDKHTYFAKTTIINPPRVELINELICSYFLRCWGLLSPDFALIQVTKDVVLEFEKEGAPLSGRYKPRYYENNLFFGSKEISPSLEIDIFINGLKKKGEFNLFRQPLDLIKIGVFDKWVANMDRKPDNPNILLGSVGLIFDIHPIDHTAAFAYLSNHKDITVPKLYLEEKFLILKTPLIKSIVAFAHGKDLQGIKIDIFDGIQRCIDEMDFIFEQVPSSWGYSKKAKAHMKKILSNKARNERIANSYFQYL